MPVLQILGFPVSNYVRSIRMLCEEKGVPYELVRAFPQSPEINAISPTGQVPCLRHGDVMLFESRAIAGYIDSVFAGPKFLPTQPVAAAVTEQWISYGNARVDRWLMREFVVPTVFADKAKGPDIARITAAGPEIEKVLGVLDRQLSSSECLSGPVLTYADLNLVPMLWAFQTLPTGRELLTAFHAVSSYYARMMTRPSFLATEPPPRRP